MNKAEANLSCRVLAIAPSFPGERSGDSKRLPLKSLLFNELEAQNVEAIIGGKVLSGERATKKQFVNLADQFSILHFATHAIVNTENSNHSLLAFHTPFDDSEHLYLQELYNLHLPAQMVTLSACETNMGPIKKGEGVASLAKGFSYAGAKSIITSLWQVSDASAKDIMPIFYDLLDRGESKDRALHLAKVQYMEQVNPALAHPFFWSAYIPIGDTRPLQGKPPSFRIYWIAAILLLSFIFGRRILKSKI